MTSVDGIVSDDRRVQADIRLGQGVSDEVVIVLQDVIELGERFVERLEIALVCFLRGCETALVDYRQKGSVRIRTDLNLKSPYLRCLRCRTP